MLEGLQDIEFLMIAGLTGTLIILTLRSQGRMARLIRERDQSRTELRDLRQTLAAQIRKSRTLQFQLQWYRQPCLGQFEPENLCQLLQSWCPDGELVTGIISNDGKLLKGTANFPGTHVGCWELSPTAWERLRTSRWGRFTFPDDFLGGTDDSSKCSLVGFLLPPWGTTQRALLLNQVPSISGQEEADAQLIASLCLENADLEAAKWSRSAPLFSEEVALIREMLELRMLTDARFDSPMELLQEFLKKLAELTGFERASLYLLNDQEPATPEFFSSGGLAVSVELAQCWQDAETNWLRDPEPIGAEPVLFDPRTWQGAPGERVFTSGLKVEIRSGREALGYLVLTSRSHGRLATHDRELIDWAAEFLPQALDRALDQAFIADEARRDGLTNLANRRTFDREIERHLQQGLVTHSPCGLLLIDLDHFKRINDVRGHLTGDAVLRKVAEVIRETVGVTRISDRPLVARYGGEEFSVLLPNVNGDGAERIAETIRRTVASCDFGDAGAPLRVTVSIGIAVAPEDGNTPEELISRADIALYDAKARGRNSVVRFAGRSSDRSLGGNSGVQGTPSAVSHSQEEFGSPGRWSPGVSTGPRGMSGT